jgi:hypothetical protein
MKNLRYILIIFILVTWQRTHAQECTQDIHLVSTQNTKSRGKTIYQISLEKIREIGSTAPKVKKDELLIKMVNETNFDVNVFIDSLYVGYIQPHQTAYQIRKKKSAFLHYWSSAGDIRWNGKVETTECHPVVFIRMNK